MTSSKSSCRNLSVVMVLDSLDHTLAQALSCFAAQSLEHQNFEVLLIGDASFREEVATLIERYSSLSIRFLTCPSETHIGRALNLGAQNARGDIVLFHDSTLFADIDLLRAHLEAHQMPSNQDLAILSSVVSDPALPPYLFNEGLRRANFLPKTFDSEPEAARPSLHGLSISLRRELFFGEASLSFTEENLSRWGAEREFLSKIEDHGMRLAQHPKACCLQRCKFTVESFTESIRNITRDTVLLAREDDSFLEECPTVKAFDASLLPYWREHLVRDAAEIDTLRNELTATEGLIARTHAQHLREQAEQTISRIAECILIFREHLAQEVLVNLHEESCGSLVESIEQEHTAGHTSKASATAPSEKTPSITVKTH